MNRCFGIVGIIILIVVVAACSSSSQNKTEDALYDSLTVTLPDSATLASFGPPMNIPLVLSANFGELRPNHFHSGLDFKTRGVTGMDVLSVANGYVSRVIVSPWGYGRAVFITHPQLGLVSVYGHLDSFSAPIADAVAKQQLADGRYDVDIELPADSIRVDKGAFIAKSGNAGSSFGPHLHFTVTDIDGDVYFDPLPFFKHLIADTAPPQVRSVSVFAKEGVVEGGRSAVRSGLPPDSVACFEAWGRVYPAVEAFDRMDGTNNVYGVKSVVLTVDGKEVYSHSVSYLPKDRLRAVNTLVDYPTLRTADRLSMVTVQPEACPLAYMIQGDGCIDVCESREYACEFAVEDFYGNSVRVPFIIEGRKMDIPAHRPQDGTAVDWSKGDRLRCEGAMVDIPPKALYDSHNIVLRRLKDGDGFAPVFTVGDPDIPLAQPISLSISVEPDSHAEKHQYCIVRIDDKGRKSYIGGEYSGGMMTADVSRFGNYTVAVDTVAPDIKPVSPNTWRANGEIRLTCRDSFSGIDHYEATIDGRWIPLEYDGKNALFTYTLPASLLAASASHTLILTVTDSRRNSTTSTLTF